ncbi:MAG: hypothetical protein M1837_004560 [Sclerophora amabilis]|nr:MAG: hypothetical protein M1837_004560 [Sclerophora amabilis]
MAARSPYSIGPESFSSPTSTSHSKLRKSPISSSTFAFQPSSASRFSRSACSDQSLAEGERALKVMHLQVFEKERTVFNQERALWDSEREHLLARIVELERLVHNLGGDIPDPFSATDTPSSSTATSSKPLKKASSFSNDTSASQFHRNARLTRQEPKVWESAWVTQGLAPTRVFPNDKGDLGKLPKISESPGSRKSKQASKKDESSTTALKGAGSRAGASQIHPDLDSINFRMTAFSPEGLKRVPSKPLNQSTSPPHHSPSSSPKESSNTTEGSSARLAPSDNLTKDAGHTPVAARARSRSESPSENATEIQRQQRRHSSSDGSIDNVIGGVNFKEFTLPEDPELAPPLALANDSAKDASFLSEVDSKLSQRLAKQPAVPPSDASSSILEAAAEVDSSTEQSEPDIPLRMKSSKNFGSAFGSSVLGMR